MAIARSAAGSSRHGEAHDFPGDVAAALVSCSVARIDFTPMARKFEFSG
jgi:hypothetical protein